VVKELKKKKKLRRGEYRGTGREPMRLSPKGDGALAQGEKREESSGESVKRRRSVQGDTLREEEDAADRCEKETG